MWEISHTKMNYTSSYTQQNDGNTGRMQKSMTKSSKQLPEKAVQLMNEWYTEHEDDPYPNRNDLDYLATTGEIKESQVKAWFSNKRNRTQNTHPKRAKRYLIRSQNQASSTGWPEPQKIHVADELEQRTFLLQQQQQQCYSNPSLAPTSWPWLPPNSYDYYQHYSNLE